jgi:plasmid stability protein
MTVSLSIKDVPDDLVERLRARARQHHRSLQGELLAILEETLVSRRLTPDEAVLQVKALGTRTSSDSVQMIRQDRDASQGR